MEEGEEAWPLASHPPLFHLHQRASFVGSLRIEAPRSVQRTVPGRERPASGMAAELDIESMISDEDLRSLLSDDPIMAGTATTFGPSLFPQVPLPLPPSAAYRLYCLPLSFFYVLYFS